MERTWLITGCSSGLGKGIAKAVLARGDRAALTARDPAALAAFTAAYPGRALALSLDLSCADSIPRAVAETQRAFGGIDVLVNNAGHGYRAAIEESQPHQVAELFAVNFFGPMATSSGPPFPVCGRGAGDGSATSPPSAGCGVPWATEITPPPKPPWSGPPRPWPRRWPPSASG